MWNFINVIKIQVKGIALLKLESAVLVSDVAYGPFVIVPLDIAWYACWVFFSPVWYTYWHRSLFDHPSLSICKTKDKGKYTLAGVFIWASYYQKSTMSAFFIWHYTAYYMYDNLLSGRPWLGQSCEDRSWPAVSCCWILTGMYHSRKWSRYI